MRERNETRSNQLDEGVNVDRTTRLNRQTRQRNDEHDEHDEQEDREERDLRPGTHETGISEQGL